MTREPSRLMVWFFKRWYGFYPGQAAVAYMDGYIDGLRGAEHASSWAVRELIISARSIDTTGANWREAKGVIVTPKKQNPYEDD